MEPQGTDFDKALYSGYLERAGTEAAEGDFFSANHYLDKAATAGRGAYVAPEDPASWVIPGGAIAEIERYRTRLVAALAAGATEAKPEAAARAQVMFDCWVEETSEGRGPEMRPLHLMFGITPDAQPQDVSACRSAFMEALAEIEAQPAPPPEPEPEPAPPPPAPEPEPEPVAAPAPEPPSRDYLVFFDFDRSEVRADAAQILGEVIEAIAELGSNRITLVGHADRSGPDAYNQRLSERRADSVKSYLTDRGIPAGDIATSGRGESDPRVPTPDGVREQQNRRVEIRLD